MSRALAWLLLVAITAGCAAVVVWQAIIGDWPVAGVFAFLAGSGSAFIAALLMNGSS